MSISGADSLCGRLVEKINSNHGPKLVLAHMPLLMVCLEGLGKLAQKFPNIAHSTSIYCLRDFLIAPSPILLKLHRQQSECSVKEHQFKVLGKLFSYLSVNCTIIFFNELELYTCAHLISSRKRNKRHEANDVVSSNGV